MVHPAAGGQAVHEEDERHVGRGVVGQRPVLEPGVVLAHLLAVIGGEDHQAVLQQTERAHLVQQLLDIGIGQPHVGVVLRDVVLEVGVAVQGVPLVDEPLGDLPVSLKEGVAEEGVLNAVRQHVGRVGVRVVDPGEESVRFGMLLQQRQSHLVHLGSAGQGAKQLGIVRELAVPPGLRELVEAAVPAELGRDHGVRDHAHGRVTALLEQRRQRQVLLGDAHGRLVGDAGRVRVQPGEHRRERAPRLWPLADRAIERHPGGRPLLQVRRGGAAIAVEAHMVRPQGVHRDQEDMPGHVQAGRRAAAGPFAAAAGEGQDGEDQKEAESL